jgi:hypothetical protein
MIKDNNNTKAELLIELRAYTNLIKDDKDLKPEIKLALSAILQILQIMSNE